MGEVDLRVDTKQFLRHERKRKAKKYLMLYIFCFFPVASLFIFNYIPIYGVIIAFKDYRIGLGIFASPWNNFKHFKDLFLDPFFFRVLKNTIIISFLKLLFGFPAPVIFALLLNEVRNQVFKRTVQSISYLPHFMSWVVLAGIIVEILSPQRGIIAYIYRIIGLKEVPNVLVNVRLFRPMLVVTNIWKNVGWGTIIYLAAISSVDPVLYDVASIDGAGRVRKMINVTMPAMMPVMVILFILSMGRLLNAGFDQIFNLYNPVVYEVADILDTYVYRVGLVKGDYAYATAVGIFKNIIGVLMVVGANLIIRRFSEYAIW